MTTGLTIHTPPIKDEREKCAVIATLGEIDGVAYIQVIDVRSFLDSYAYPESTPQIMIKLTSFQRLTPVEAKFLAKRLQLAAEYAEGVVK